MDKRCSFSVAAVLVAASLAAAADGARNPVRFSLEARVPLSGVGGRIDHMALDRGGKRLFVAALGNNTIEVVDLARAERIAQIKGLGEPQGVVYVPDLNRVYVSEAVSGDCVAFSLPHLQPAVRIHVGSDADNLRYDSLTGSLYAGYGREPGGIAVISVWEDSVVRRIRLPVHPEAFVLGPNDMIFVNLPGAGRVSVVDSRGKVERSWPLNEPRENFALALDTGGRRLFAGCREPPRLVVMDADSGRVIAERSIAADPDDLYLDAARSLVYVSCGAGSIDVIDAAPGRGYGTVASIATGPGARTSLYDGEQSLFYVALPARAGKEAEIRVYRVGP